MPAQEEEKQRIKKLGEYIPMDPEKLETALEHQRRLSQSGERRLLGELLVEEQALPRAGLEDALAHQRTDRLRSCQVFKDLTPEAFKIISGHAIEVCVEAGEDFIRQDVPGDCFFILIDGDVLVYRDGAHDEKVDLVAIEAGETIGEMGYFGDGRRLASDRAKGKKRPVRIYEVLGGRETTPSAGQKLLGEGFTLYRKMDFEKAAERFERGLESDPVCRVFLDRCRHLLSRPPEADWDGVWVSQE